MKWGSMWMAAWKLLVGWLLWPPLLGSALAGLAVTLLWRRGRTHRDNAQWEQARRAELEAYCRLEVTLVAAGQARKLARQAKRVCGLIVEKSVFSHAALLLLDAHGQLVTVGSARMNDLTLAALDACGERLLHAEVGSSNNPAKSFSVRLTDHAPSPLPADHTESPHLAGIDCHKVLIVPVRMHRGRLVGALALCAEASVERTAAHCGWMMDGEWIAGALIPLELLAAKLARLVERNLLMERLMQVERIAGAGQIVAGVAQDLAAPLAATLGLAELVASRASDPRVLQDAVSIATHAREMGETLGRLGGFWRPVPSDPDAFADTGEESIPNND